jgi:hypothetical protein
MQPYNVHPGRNDVLPGVDAACGEAHLASGSSINHYRLSSAIKKKELTCSRIQVFCNHSNLSEAKLPSVLRLFSLFVLAANSLLSGGVGVMRLTPDQFCSFYRLATSLSNRSRSFVGGSSPLWAKR